jgi:hypothetical protein
MVRESPGAIANAVTNKSCCRNPKRFLPPRTPPAKPSLGETAIRDRTNPPVADAGRADAD